MRRFLLLLVGLVWSGGVMFALCSSGARQYAQAREPETTALCVELPCRVADTQLVAQQLVIYEGAFREDGSNREVGEVAALLVTNEGGTMVSEGAVILDWGADRMVFEVFSLPPGATVLVQEKNEKSYAETEFTACYGWNRTEYPENSGVVAVEETGSTCMLVINHANATIPLVRIRYKSIDPGSGIYMGGICYTVEVKDLRPGEIRMISPQHFLCGYSRVVGVTTEYQ